MTDVDSSQSTSPAAIDAVPLRHPWRWVAAVVIVILVVLFLYGMATNPAYRWKIFAEYLFNDRIYVRVCGTPCSSPSTRWCWRSCLACSSP